MPPFETSANEKTKNIDTSSHFNETLIDVNDSLQSHKSFPTSIVWGSLHNSYGKKILIDKENWISENKILHFN